MRAAILGATIDDRRTLREFVRALSRITHSGSRAEQGALAVALAARMAREGETVPVDTYLDELASLLDGEGGELLANVARASTAVGGGITIESFAKSLGLDNGVTGYVCHSVPVAIHAWLTHQRDYRSAVTPLVRRGGDTDSTGAMVGGIVGTALGRRGIPRIS